MMKEQFPALAGDIVYLDNAATTQVPFVVLAAMQQFEIEGRANAHRGLYPWAERATVAYEDARATVAAFVGVQPGQLAFARGTTEGLNLAARSIAANLGTGDEVIVSRLEHHANLLPWIELGKERGFTVRIVDPGEIIAAMSSRTKVLAITHVSNVTGEMLPVRELADSAHAVGAIVVLDAAQSVGHIPVDFSSLGVDVMAFSAHKMYGPMGIGALVATPELMARFRPLSYGGGIVQDIALDGQATYKSAPDFLEAGSPNISGAVGFSEAVRWLLAIGMDSIAAHEAGLSRYLRDRLVECPWVRMIETRFPTIGILSFTVDGVHAHDIAEVLGRQGVCVRAGHLCAAPFVKSVASEGAVRVSLGVYNDEQDIDRLLKALHEARRLFS